MSVTIQLRRDTAANWTSVNPVLHQGEIGVETDTNKAKFGDGSTAWSSLAYWSPGGTGFPGTTLGDTAYENATPAPARLPGNTTTTKNFLTQTGTGSVSAAPAWGTIAVGDIPSLTTTFSFTSTGAAPSSGTYTTGQVLVDQNGVIRVCTAGGSPGTWTRAGQRPWEFYVDDYGAKGNGKIFTDGVTNGTTTFTSATATFTSGDTGKWIMINGGGGTGAAPVLTTITFVNSTTVTLGSAAGASATSCAFIYGTDDTSALNSAMTAGSAYATANDYMFDLILSSSYYISATLTQQSSPVVYNTQILVPYPVVTGLSRKLMVTIRGAGRSSALQYWESVAPNVQGSAIISMLTAPSSVDGTFFYQSVVGGPSASGAFTGGFANTHLTVQNCSIWCAAFTNIKALDMKYLSGCDLDGYASNIFAPANNTSAAAAAHPYLSDLPASATFQNSIGVGIVFPISSNNDSCRFGSIAVEGYEIGILDAYDHLTGGRLATLYCDVCIRADPSQTHELSIQSVSAEQFNGGIRVVGSGGANLRLNIGWDGECTSPNYDISDASNIATGIVRWNDLFHATPIVSGASALKVVNDRLGPGYWSGAPAVPATVTNQQNTAWRDATIVITSGGAAVTVITVDGQATGLTLGTSGAVTVRLPAGKNIQMTYASTAPTWKWWLD